MPALKSAFPYACVYPNALRRAWWACGGKDIIEFGLITLDVRYAEARRKELERTATIVFRDAL